MAGFAANCRRPPLAYVSVYFAYLFIDLDNQLILLVRNLLAVLINLVFLGNKDVLFKNLIHKGHYHMDSAGQLHIVVRSLILEVKRNNEVLKTIKHPADESISIVALVFLGHVERELVNMLRQALESLIDTRQLILRNSIVDKILY